MNWKRELDLAAQAAQAAASLLRESFSLDAGVRHRDGKDIKTRADVEAETLILRALASTRLPVIAEETANQGRQPAGPHWLVDPLDGTMNFSRTFPMHAVSIGLWDGNRPVLGAIADISRNAIYTGLVDSGAHRDRTPIRVSTVADCSQAILTTGFPTGRNYGSDALAAFVSRVQAFKKIRMIGSAAMSLAMVAQGSFEAYLEEDVMLWDVGAGLALVVAAGGQIDIRPGTKPLSVIVTASNGLIGL